MKTPAGWKTTGEKVDGKQTYANADGSQEVRWSPVKGRWYVLDVAAGERRSYDDDPAVLMGQVADGLPQGGLF